MKKNLTALLAGLAFAGVNAAAETVYTPDGTFFQQLNKLQAQLRAREKGPEGPAIEAAPQAPASPLAQATYALRDATYGLTQAEFALVKAILNDRIPQAELGAFLRAGEAYASKFDAARSAAAQCGNAELGKQYSQKLDAFDAAVREFVKTVLAYAKEAQGWHWGSQAEKLRKALTLYAQAAAVNSLCQELAALAESTF